MRKSIKFKKVITVLTIMSLMVSTVMPVMAESAKKSIGGKDFIGIATRDSSAISYYKMNDELKRDPNSNIVAQTMRIQGTWKQSDGSLESGVDTGNIASVTKITATETKGPTGMYTQYIYNGTVKYNNKTDVISFSVSLK